MTLENLVRIREIKLEPPDPREFRGLATAAADKLTDSQNLDLSFTSRFNLAYGAAHGLALAALRAAGYRTDKRYMVFQCLAHTTELASAQIRIFIACHEKRNLAEYEGQFDADEQLLSELIANTKLLKEYLDGVEL